ncbi:hypothetical protein OG883_38745 [Streptomyces sp. NBC_01142]|uniref:hypothetical protein n=1 Tax=Streptomyces sp. NBC_01142 TaxID=2975865 RepID=UPI0022558A6C|nr:hypothetical protein [Streptomyces sp. NBC_01142]MCX4825683.1 hypothetical protein [Streptomyces sp. NBC_01142]
MTPQFWGSYAMLADVVFRRSVVRFAQEQGKKEIKPEEMPALAEEATALAREAIRLGPEEIYAYETALLIAGFSGAKEDADQFERAILRLDPSHPGALERQTAKAAKAPETGATQAPPCTPTGWPSHPTTLPCAAASTKPPSGCCAAPAGSPLPASPQQA